MHPHTPTVADVARLARVAHRWTVREMADRAGVSPMTIQRVERGDRVRGMTWRAIARAFDVDGDSLVLAAWELQDPAQVSDILGVSVHSPGSPGTEVAGSGPAEFYESVWDENGREIPTGDVIVRRVQVDGSETYTNIIFLMRVAPLQQIATGLLLRLQNQAPLSPAQAQLLDAALDVLKEEAGITPVDDEPRITRRRTLPAGSFPEQNRPAPDDSAEERARLLGKAQLETDGHRSGPRSPGSS